MRRADVPESADTYPCLSAIAVKAKPGRPLLVLLEEGAAWPLVHQLEMDLEYLQRRHRDLAAIGALDHLVGEEKHFLSGAAEIIGLAWLARRDLLRATNVPVAKTYTLTGKGADIDASAGLNRGKSVLLDIKSVQAHFQTFLGALSDEVERAAIAAGLAETRVSLAVKGSPNLAYAGQHRKEILAACISQLGSLAVRETYVWNAPELRLTAQLRSKGRVRSKLASVAGEVRARQAQLWNQCDQVTSHKPFVLMLVRTDMMGLDTVGLEDELRLALLGGRQLADVPPLFGSTSTARAFATATVAKVQSCLSGVLFLDARRGVMRAHFFQNRFAKHQISRGLDKKLRAPTTSETMLP